MQQQREPLVDEAAFLQANSHYAYVCYPDGREKTGACTQKTNFIRIGRTVDVLFLVNMFCCVGVFPK